LPKYSRTTDEEKQEVVRRHLENPEVSDEQALRIVRAKISWKDWFFLDYARYLYWLAVLFADVFLVLWLVDGLGLSPASGAVLALVTFGVLLAVEAFILTLIWPKKIIDRDDVE